eukprot:gb/GEZN01010669.1/.p1 GENE.gb/GEZN01010669.1/~~gb/GEZN01010669.1/.p1  ORF type:complete len:343 (-),score=61.02 gb/GEZN01010669.1/:180-1208(-)
MSQRLRASLMQLAAMSQARAKQPKLASSQTKQGPTLVVSSQTKQESALVASSQSHVNQELKLVARSQEQPKQQQPPAEVQPTLSNAGSPSLEIGLPLNNKQTAELLCRSVRRRRKTSVTSSPPPASAKSCNKKRRILDLSQVNLACPLSDVLGTGLDLLWCGINPGRVSGAAGYHYANNGNHFWSLLHDSGLTDVRLRPQQQEELLKYRMGMTNLVERMTPSSSDLSVDEMQNGKAALLLKVQQSDARILCFNGKCIFDAILGRPKLTNFAFGQQDPSVSVRIFGSSLSHVVCFVIPSTSGRVSAYQRKDKLVFFEQLRELRDVMKLESRQKHILSSEAAQH